ncbi:MAG: ATP-dependent helicase, partial [Candidatus Dormibacteraceae bacterium]
MSSALQSPAQTDPRRPHLIAAGPGTGKTHTMVERYLWLVEHEHLASDSILAVTFTDAAAGEWRDRLEERLGEPLDDAPIGTFHGICSRLLQEHAYEIGLPREHRALDDVDQRLLQRALAADLLSGAAGQLPQDLRVLQPDDIDALLRAGPNFALQLKGRGIDPAGFLRVALLRHEAAWGPDATGQIARAELESIRVLHAVYAAYEERLQALGRLDFDDLLLKVSSALERFQGFAQACHRRFSHILVDEFQDTNRLQLELVRRLAAPQFGNVTAVGDEKQSIYGWRDADIANITRRFPGERLPLTRNWRSRQEILDLATDFIRRDPGFRQEPVLEAARGSGGRCVSLVMARDAEIEARQIVAQVAAQIRGGRTPGRIAILASTLRGLPAAFENELRAQGVPYVTSAGSGLFDREEVKDMLALLRLVADPMDDGALTRVLQGPIVRLSDRALYRIAHRRLQLQDDGISLYRERGVRLRDCVERARREGWPELAQVEARRVEKMLAAVDELGLQSDTLSTAELLQRALGVTGYLRHARLRSRREGPRALRNLHKV